MAIYDLIFTKREGGDPTMPVIASTNEGTTIGNPGFRERTNGKLLFKDNHWKLVNY